jgi:hypothetical protein
VACLAATVVVGSAPFEVGKARELAAWAQDTPSPSKTPTAIVKHHSRSGGDITAKARQLAKDIATRDRGIAQATKDQAAFHAQAQAARAQQAYAEAYVEYEKKHVVYDNARIQYEKDMVDYQDRDAILIASGLSTAAARARQKRYSQDDAYAYVKDFAERSGLPVGPALDHSVILLTDKVYSFGSMEEVYSWLVSTEASVDKTKVEPTAPAEPMRPNPADYGIAPLATPAAMPTPRPHTQHRAVRLTPIAKSRAPDQLTDPEGLERWRYDQAMKQRFPYGMQKGYDPSPSPKFSPGIDPKVLDFVHKEREKWHQYYSGHGPAPSSNGLLPR